MPTARTSKRTPSSPKSTSSAQTDEQGDRPTATPWVILGGLAGAAFVAAGWAATWWYSSSQKSTTSTAPSGGAASNNASRSASPAPASRDDTSSPQLLRQHSEETHRKAKNFGNFDPDTVEKVTAHEGDKACCICMEHRQDCVVMPCSHISMCQQCAAAQDECPVCRIEIAQRMRVFFS